MNTNTIETAAMELLGDIIVQDLNLTLYACGAMNDAQRIDFEEQLDESPELCQELIELLEQRNLPYEMMERAPSIAPPSRHHLKDVASKHISQVEHPTMQWLLNALNSLVLTPLPAPAFAHTSETHKFREPQLSGDGLFIVEDSVRGQDILYTLTCIEDLPEKLHVLARAELSNGNVWEQKIRFVNNSAEVRVTANQRAHFVGGITFQWSEEDNA